MIMQLLEFYFTISILPFAIAFMCLYFWAADKIFERIIGMSISDFLSDLISQVCAFINKIIPLSKR